jgi:hypothetical protein
VTRDLIYPPGDSYSGPPPGADEPFRLRALPAHTWDRRRVAREFGVSQTTISRWADCGRLPHPCERRDGKLFWDSDALAGPLRRHRQYAK